MLLPWIVIFTTLAISPNGNVSVSTNSARFLDERTCLTVSHDYVYRKTGDAGVTVIGSARCYSDGGP